MAHQPEQPPIVPNGDGDLKKIDGAPEDTGGSTRVRFTVFGEEMIEKEVKPAGNAGRIYLPLDWMGKVVKIIRID